ncbi:hypothetical protein [Sphingobium algorifonticola]|nr:hypothetical protein [Sphingobium algorifonticola]
MIEWRTMRRASGPGLLIMALSACAAVPSAPPPTAATRPAVPMAGAYGKPTMLTGMDARRLIQMFGTPRLDIRDPHVRKLQFANGRCILDTYLYAPAKGKEPVVSYADSRQPSGMEMDPAACAALLAAK